MLKFQALSEERDEWERRALAAEATVNDVIEALGAQEDVDAGRAIADAAKGERDGRNMAIDTMLKMERERDEALTELAEVKSNWERCAEAGREREELVTRLLVLLDRVLDETTPLSLGLALASEIVAALAAKGGAT